MNTEITITIELATHSGIDDHSTEVKLNTYADPLTALPAMAEDAVRRALASVMAKDEADAVCAYDRAMQAEADACRERVESRLREQ